MEVLARGRKRRWRQAGVPPGALPDLRPEEREILLVWARSHAASRTIASLRQEAGAAGLDRVERLAEALARGGWAVLDEELKGGQWQLRGLSWCELPRLQQALGLRTRAERDAARDEADEALAALAAEAPAELQAAVASLQAVRLGSAARSARIELLHALQRWRAERRRGHRRHFALHARPGTKAVTTQEWAWLAEHVDLEAWGIERFADILWLAGDVRLRFVGGALDLHALPFIGLPHAALGQLGAADGARRHWLIENRASFEQQARQRPEGTLLAWLPGRPTGSWCEAWRRVLAAAPAPVVSATATPAGR